MPFLIHPAPELLERHSCRRNAHATLAAKIRALLASSSSEGIGPAQEPREMASPRGRQIGRDGLGQPGEPMREPLSEAEMRVLRYLPTNLTVPEIAGELYLSVHTIKTHVRHLYTKLGVHGRREAVQQARALGLLAPSPRRR